MLNSKSLLLIAAMAAPAASMSLEPMSDDEMGVVKLYASPHQPTADDNNNINNHIRTLETYNYTHYHKQAMEAESVIYDNLSQKMFSDGSYQHGDYNQSHPDNMTRWETISKNIDSDGDNLFGFRVEVRR